MTFNCENKQNTPEYFKFSENVTFPLKLAL